MICIVNLQMSYMWLKRKEMLAKQVGKSGDKNDHDNHIIYTIRISVR